MARLGDEARPFGVTSLAVSASLCAHILSLALPLALLQTYDRILPSEAYTTTFVLAIGVIAAILLEGALRYGRAVLFAHVGAVFESRMTLRLVDHVMRANGGAVHALGTPALTDSIRAVGQVRDFWSGNAAATLHELPFVAIYILLIAYIASWLALVPLALTIVALLAAILIARAARAAVNDLEEAETRRRNLVWGILGGLVEVKTMAAEPILTRRYRDAAAGVMDASARAETQMALIRENGALLSQVSTILVVTLGAYMVISGQLSTGGLAACTLLAGRSIGPAMGAFAYLSRLAYRREATEKINTVLSLPEAPLFSGRAGERAFQGGAIEISGPAIEGGSVSIPQGSVVHVGAPDSPTATSVLETLAGIDNSLGLTITLEGLPYSAYDPQSLDHRIVMVSGQTALVRGTLLDNLTLFSPQYDADAIRLTQRLGLESFVGSLHAGFMTPIGPTGAEVITPGIAARIGLIRALVRRPAILCLDEVGGALDLDGMRRLIEILKELKGHVTIFLVASNPAKMELVDRQLRIIRSAVHE